MYTINFWPILISTVVAFGLGALWYSPILFGKDWMALAKVDPKVMAADQNKGPWKAYVVHFIALFITFSVLGFIISASNAITSTDGAFLGFLAWLGFVAIDAVASLMWEKRPMRLVLINTVITLVTLIIGGAIIGAWK